MQATSGRVRVDSDSDAAVEIRRVHPDAKRITIRRVGTDWYEYTVMEDDNGQG